MDGILFTGVADSSPLVTWVEAEGFDTDVVPSLRQLRPYLAQARPRLVVVTADPLATVTHLREVDTAIPILVVGTGAAGEEAVCLGAGADCYLAPPVDGPRLGVWIEALLRRLERSPLGQERYTFGDLDVDVFRRTVKHKSWRIVMSATEFDLLVHLVRNRGRVVSREEILKEVWKYDTCPTTRTVDNFICKLRRKIGDDVEGRHWLSTVKGVGYRLDIPE